MTDNTTHSFGDKVQFYCLGSAENPHKRILVGGAFQDSEKVVEHVNGVAEMFGFGEDYFNVPTGARPVKHSFNAKPSKHLTAHKKLDGSFSYQIKCPKCGRQRRFTDEQLGKLIRHVLETGNEELLKM